MGEKWRVRYAVLGSAVVVLLFAIPLVIPFDLVTAAQLTVGDLLFERESGPHLAYRNHRPDIVLVTQDTKTAGEIGTPTLATDRELYRALLAQGATVVGDPRPINSAAGAVELIRGIDALPLGPGHIFRNIEIPSTADFLSDQQKRDRIGGDVIWADVGYDVLHTVRFYPLLWVDQDGTTDETLALKVARVALGGRPDPNPVRTAFDAGVLGLWVRLSGASAPPGSGLEQATHITPSRYPLTADHAISWTVHPSREFSALVAPASIWIEYRSAPGGYVSYSYIDALNGRLPANALRDKIVLIDASGPIFPVATSATRTETWAAVDAAAIEGILDNSYTTPTPGLLAFLFIVMLGLAGGLIVALASPLRAALAWSLLFVGYLALCVGLYRGGLYPDLFLAPGALVASAALQGTRRYAREVRDRRRIFDLFGRYVPRTVVAELVRRPHEQALAMGGQKREVTVLFADIRGFTSFSERFPPDQVLEQLNLVLRGLVRSAFEEEGTVDKYIGDAVMVLFNAPLGQADHGERAVRAALKMRAASAENELAVGIGIHLGEAVIGNVGTPERLEYTAIGATVNLAARLCETAARGEIIVSDAVHARLAGRLEAEPQAPIRAKGIDRDLYTYRVTGIRPSAVE